MHSYARQELLDAPAASPQRTDVDRINHDWYERTQAIANLNGDDFLEPSLILILFKYHNFLVDRPVLDMGIGAGRTTLYLSRLTRAYVGIDYSEAMVRHSRHRFPGLRIDLCDASDLGRFRDGSFAFAVFSYNGLDCMSHVARLCALSEISRVLQPGGIFAFSAHNRDFANAKAGPRLHLSRNPITQASNVVHWIRTARKHARLRMFEYEGLEYALVNDVADDYSLIYYYITKEMQRLQLERAGLELLEMYDHRSNPLRDGMECATTPWIWYVARKGG